MGPLLPDSSCYSSMHTKGTDDQLGEFIPRSALFPTEGPLGADYRIGTGSAPFSGSQFIESHLDSTAIYGPSSYGTLLSYKVIVVIVLILRDTFIFFISDKFIL